MRIANPNVVNRKTLISEPFVVVRSAAPFTIPQKNFHRGAEGCDVIRQSSDHELILTTEIGLALIWCDFHWQLELSSNKKGAQASRGAQAWKRAVGFARGAQACYRGACGKRGWHAIQGAQGTGGAQASKRAASRSRGAQARGGGAGSKEGWHAIKGAQGTKGPQATEGGCDLLKGGTKRR